MRFTVNTNGEVINGMMGQDSYSILFTKEAYDTLMKLQEESEKVDSLQEFNAVVEKGKEFINSTSVEMEGVINNPYLFFNKKTNTYHLKHGNQYSKLPIPKVLVDRILLSMDKGIDYTPVIKMVARVMRNPKVLKGNMDFLNRFANYVNIKVVNPDMVDSLVKDKGFAPEVAREMAKMYSIQITNEGMLLCYKVSEEIMHKWELDDEGNPIKKDRYPVTKKIDPISGLISYSEPEMPNAEDRLFQPPVMKTNGDPFYVVPTDFNGDFAGFTPGHIIQVGKIITHDTWDKVNTNDHQSCVEGLHVGGIDYIRGYQHTNTQTHNVIVDPMDIGAICDDSTGAMRVLRYFVQDVFKGVNNSIYNSSMYAKFTDAQFDKFVQETIKNINTHVKDTAEMAESDAEYLKSLYSNPNIA